MGFTQKRILFIYLTGFFLTMPSVVFAGADSGFYIGAGVGDAKVEATNFDESDSAFKVFGGYNIGFIPLVDFAVEASYVDFGKPTSNLTSVELTGLNAFGLAGLSFGPLGVFAKAGMISWDSDTVIGTATTSNSGTDTAYGVGARFSISSFAVRAEYEAYDIENLDDVSMVSVSAVFTF